MDIATILAEALKAVETAKVPKELQQVAFEKAVEILSGQSAPAAAPAHGTASGAPAGMVAPAVEGGTDSIGRIATKLGIDRESAERVFHIEDDDLKLVLPSSKLASPKKTATEEIALLVVAGRQASGLDQETTDADKIRTVAEHYRKYDPPNFSRTIKDMRDLFIVRENGRKKMIKMTQPGWEAAQQLVSRIVGGE
ncbi:hypothetical protein MX659_02300 [Coriobacteriia bacterium Es71-Z0120]|uniref:hypothetical protein n=1 Tax=Parvivirga hydrogeniphila TaxID=2939460 RepID=UPI002260BC9C|nr:hypothetical protein [Parvivirga hydrogeniphila]MCL4078435.1 hypothetical protein [Parvivirga hydrogeniphila]